MDFTRPGFFGRFDPEYLDGRVWRLNNKDNAWGLVTSTGVIISPPHGFLTDLASVPRPLWYVFPPTGDGPRRAWGPAATIHDYLYQTGKVNEEEIPRAWADHQFLEGMLLSDITPEAAFVLYFGVRLGGWLAWKKYRRGDAV